jgi:hypothetical protein
MGSEIALPIDKSIFFQKKMLVFLRMCIFCSTFARFFAGLRACAYA